MWRVVRNKNNSLKELFDKVEDENLTELEDFSALIDDFDCNVFEPDLL